jgi:Spy/CpxP family protein refolding chaperone
MDIFTQNKLLIRGAIVLAVLNIASIGVFVWKDFIRSPHPNGQYINGRPPRPEDFKDGRPPRPEDFENRPPQYNGAQDVSTVLEKELHLTTSQVAQIQVLRADFFTKEQVLATSIRAKRDSMNELMFNKLTDETVVKALARGIAEQEYQMELLRLEQAQNLKTICTPEQLERFNDLVKEIRDYFKPNK